MIKESGVVAKVDLGGVWVETQKQSVCGACLARKGCGQKLLNSFGGSQFHVLAKISPQLQHRNINEGDSVVIGIAEGVLVKGAMLMYGVPLLVFILSLALLTFTFGESGWGGIIISLLSLFLGGLWTRHHVSSSNNSEQYQPIVLEHCAPLIPANNQL